MKIFDTFTSALKNKTTLLAVCLITLPFALRAEEASAEKPGFLSVIHKKNENEVKKEVVSTEAPTLPKKEDEALKAAPATPKKKKHKKKIPTTTRDNEPLSPSEQPKTVDSKEILISKWSGLRTKLAENGVQFEAVYKGEVSSNLNGGVKKGTVYLGNFDLKTSINAEPLLGIKGINAFLYLIVDHGKDPSANVGDAQGTSNIETPVNTLKIYEAWIQKSFLDEKGSVLIGLHDLNSEFYVTETSGLFLNSSFGIGKEFSQTGVNGPSIFPTTALALRVRSEIGKSFYLQTGIFNAIAGDPKNPRGTHIKTDGNYGALVVSEMAYIRGREEKSENNYSKYGFGLWSYTKTFDHISETVNGTTIPVKANNNGYYFLAEQTIFEPLAFFARYGVASSEINRFHSNFSYGLVATGLIPSRNNDRLGIAATTVSNGTEYKKLNEAQLTPVSSDETTYEISYRIELKKGFAIQPDFQWVLHPNTDPALKAAKVGVIRFEIAL